MLCEICQLFIAVNRETGGAECTRPGRTKNCWRESQMGREVQQEVHYDIMSLIRADSNQLGLACNCRPLRTFPPLTLYKELCHVITGLSVQEAAMCGRAFVWVSGSRAVKDPVTPSTYLPSRVLWSTSLSPSSSQDPVFLSKGQHLA
ncbi:hypothetical protein KIL84_011152 [Mauremys mutica]|uniref:Uncharacterized protein n=1 Tax=Mauremys mutica TaxID=74926 RepID=A0A9D4B261_9SAUR|nr:hypothetical protein KIL84_011152 [Mauremys mutica]